MRQNTNTCHVTKELYLGLHLCIYAVLRFPDRKSRVGGQLRREGESCEETAIQVAPQEWASSNQTPLRSSTRKVSQLTSGRIHSG